MKRNLLQLLLLLAVLIVGSGTARGEEDYTSLMGEWTGTYGSYGVPGFQNGKESYRQGSDYETGWIILSSSFEAPKKGIYEIKFYAVTSSTSGRGWNNVWGSNIAQAFASAGNNKVSVPMEVINQTGCTLAQDANIRTLSIEAEEGQTIQYGLENVGNGGNWYTIQKISAKMKTVAEIFQTQYEEAYNIWQYSTENETGARATFKESVDALGAAMNGTLAEAQEASNNLAEAVEIYKYKSYPVKGHGVKYDFTSKMNMAINAWTCKQGNGPAQYGFTGATETYGVNGAGEVMYQNITGLSNGTYEIHFYAVANAANGGGTDGDNLAYVYANDVKQDIPVIKQNACDPSDFEQTLTVTIADGTIKYGVTNYAAAGNWYVCKNVALFMIGEPDLSSYRDAITEKLDIANAIKDEEMNANVAANLVNAISGAEGYESISVIGTLETIKDNLQNAIDAAKASINLRDLLAHAQSLYDNTNLTNGKNDLNTAIETATTAYNSTTSNLDEAATALQNAINAFCLLNLKVFEGQYYVQHINSGLFIAAGHNYGTRGIVNQYGLDITLTKEAGDCVSFDSQVFNGDNKHFLGSNLYMDSEKFNWSIIPLGDDKYCISNGSQFIGVDDNNNLKLTDSQEAWKFFTSEEIKASRIATLQAASAENEMDATFLLTAPNFNRGDRRNETAWSVSENCTNHNLSGGNETNNCAESFRSIFTISQKIEGIPNGIYKMTAQGFYDQRDGLTEEAPVFFVNGKNQAAPAMSGSENNMAQASESFTNGDYCINAIEAIVIDGCLEIGIKGTATHQWVIFDNFQLTYLGSLAEATSIGELSNFADEKVILNTSVLEVLNNNKETSEIIVQDAKGEQPLGIMFTETGNINGASSAEYGKTINVLLLGTYNTDLHEFTIEEHISNRIYAVGNGSTINNMEIAEATDKANTFLLVKIENSTIAEKGGAFYATSGNNEIKIDKRLDETIKVNNGDLAYEITGITFIDGDVCVLAPLSKNTIVDNKAEATEGDAYNQGDNVAEVEGIIMTFGGDDEDGAKYEFKGVTPEVNGFASNTTGIGKLPVDAGGKSYDKTLKNVPTQGTYYKFEPTKDGQLEVTVGIEKDKTLIVTEDGEQILEQNQATNFEGPVVFPVEATKAYYVFAPETNLKLFGYKYILDDANAENIVNNIANFKLLPQDNEDGDTLILKDAIVTYIKGDNVFVEDASGAIVFYQTGIQFYVGQKLNGFIVGKNTFIADDNKLPALKRTENTSYKTFKVTENVTPEAKAIAAAEAQKQTSLARFVKLTDVRARKDDKGFHIFVDEQGKGNSIRFEDRFNVFYELPEVIGSVQGIVGINSDGIQIFWPTSKDVPEGVGLSDAEEALLAEAQKLAEDREAVAVGLLDDAITEALAGNGKGLQAAIDQFKANNADQEKDETPKVGVSAESWTGASGLVGWAAPEITTYDGRKTALAERYESTVATTGEILSQTISGLENGLYKVGFYANAFFTSGRGFDSDMADGATDVAYVFANDKKEFIPGKIATSTTENAYRQFNIEVTDGTVKLGLGKEKAGTNWHTIQIHQLTWFTTAKQIYAVDKTKMQELIGQAEELAADAEKTAGKEELNTALEAAKAAQESIRLNIPEFETEIGKLSAAIDAFNAPYLLLAEAQELAEDRDAVAVGLLDDAITEAQANGLTDTADLQEAVDQFKANNANNAKETYAADKASMQTLIGQAEELAADEALVNNKEELNTAITAAKAALASNKLTVPEFETEIGNMRQAIADFKEANHMGENTLASGKYVLKNVASGLFWGAGNNWGTRASLLDHSEFVTLTMKPDGKYNMESQVSNGGNAHFFEGDYMDNGTPKALTITPVIEESEEIVDFDGSFYHNWSEVSGTATDNGSANGGLKLNQEVEIGGSIWGNLTGAVPYKNYANITDYKELRIEGTPGATIRLMCNRVTDEGPIYEIKPTFDADGKITIKIDDLKYLNGGTPCDFVALQSIKVPASWAGGTMAATITSMKLVKTSEKAFYTIADGDKCFGYDGTSTVLGKELAANDEKALWEIVPATAAALATATEDEPVDATFMILDSDFGRNNRYAKGLANDANNTKNADLDPAWTFEASNKNNAGLNENMCVESYHSVFNMSQTLADAPKGIYSLTAQAFYRQDGSDNEHLPVFFANDETQTFPLKTGTENSMNDASTSFSNGLYTIEPIFVEVTENGALTVGAKLEGNTALWCIWDNFKLTYYGTEANIENLKSGAETKELKELRQKATQLQNEVEIAAIKTGLTNALNETANVAGAEAVKAAIATLKAAIDPAEASKTAKNVLPKMKQLIDATNVYTQEAYDQYYGTWLAKYEAGTLTKAEADALQDPSVGTGWHAPITVDNFLLSAWDTNPDFTDAPYYINTWSVEGDNDGTNFRVPFFEYFNQEPNILAENTLTATMNGLEAGDYEVTAWVRARAKDAEQTSVYGITMQANDGEAVDVCTGEKVDQFFLNEFTAKGTVGADGVLNIKFNVAADNNIHWLSFKNVKFAKAGSTEPIIEPIDPDLIEIAQDQGKELDNFQRAELEEGNAYNTYTANADLVIAFKMMNIDVTNCDYVVVKFAEPVAAGWHLAFWSNQDLVDVPAGATEYKYVFAEDPKCGVQDGILPQICMMTFFGGYQAPLVAKVTGIYKHQIPAEIAHTWDFTKWSDATVANLKADATASKVAGWSDVEKKADAEAGNEPTALSKDNCFWAIIPEGGELSANGVAIEELKGLYFGESFAGNRSLAIAVNYAEVDASKGFGPYNGPAYLWLGGKNFDCFTIPAVKGGTTIKMGVESHKISDARGVKLLVDGNELTDPDGNAVAAPMTYTEQTWQVPAGIAHNVVVKNTNGCHIYFIDAEQDEATLTSISNVKGYDQNDAIYNLRGQKVQGTLKKGLYIKSGRKVVIK